MTPHADVMGRLAEMRQQIHDTLFRAVEEHKGEYIYECATDAVLALLAPSVAEIARQERELQGMDEVVKRMQAAGVEALQRAEAAEQRVTELSEVISPLIRDYQQLLGDGLTTENEPDVLKRVRVALTRPASGGGETS